MDRRHLQNLCDPFGCSAENLVPLGHSQNEVYEHREPERVSILRVSSNRGRTEKQISGEMEWIEALAQAGVPVVRPLASLQGKFCESVVVDGIEYLVSLFQRAPGRKVENTDLTLDLYRSLGVLTARLHRFSFDRDDRPSYERLRPTWNQSRILQADLECDLPGIDDRFRSAVRDLIDEIRRQQSQPEALIHADISFTNVFVDHGHLWLFDFDNCEIGTVCQDLSTILYDSIYCRVLHRVSPDELPHKIRERWDALLNGYQSVRHLERQELASLEKFAILREAVIYLHYCRTIPRSAMSDSWRAGMEEMKANVERSVTPIPLPLS